MLNAAAALSLAYSILGGLCALFLGAFIMHRRAYKTIPGPRVSLFGDLARIPPDPESGGRYRAILDCILKYSGGAGIIRLAVKPFTTHVFVTNPELIKEIMVTHRADWSIADRSTIKLITGDGLFVAKDESWRFQRDTVSPLFHFDHLLPLTDTIVECTGVLVDKLHRAAASGEVIDIHSHFTQLALDVLGKTTFGQTLAAQTDTPSEIARALRKIVFGSHGQSTETQHNLDGLREQLLGIIRARRTEVNDGSRVPMDLLSQLIEARDPQTKSGLTDDQILAEIMTFLTAGNDTTANLLAWVVLSMCQNPELAHRLEESVGRVSSPHSPTHGLREDGESASDFLDCVIHETLRFHAPVPMCARVAIRDVVIGGKFGIPKGTCVVVPVWSLHHHPDLWDNPEVFDPSRFERSNHGQATSPFAYIPFSTGHRRCVGSNFAMLESRLVLTELYRHFRFELSDTTIEAVADVVRHPKGGLNVTVALQ